MEKSIGNVENCADLVIRLERRDRRKEFVEDVSGI